MDTSKMTVFEEMVYQRARIATLEHELDAERKFSRSLVEALEAIDEVEPVSDTSRLGAVEWSRALDKAQSIARAALAADPAPREEANNG